ncbi:MAG: N-acetylmuramic acid 6-phosphate etherase [Acutalibacteraceae bacterium]
MTVGIGDLSTEKRNPKTMNLDQLSVLEKVKIMNEEDKLVALAVEKELESIAAVIEKSSDLFGRGGRIIYCGAGTSGRIGILDAVEVLPTFGVTQDRIVSLMAGGTKNYGEAGEADEDDEAQGEGDVEALKVNANDILIGVAASGRTPYVIGALKKARSMGASTAAVACNKNSEIAKYADYVIEIDCGPEFITGSTRLKAGTAQKLVLNMISTITMTEAGKTYSNLMVDVNVSNIKLKERWKKILTDATGCSYEEAEQLYKASKGAAKVAILMYILKIDYSAAVELLKNNDGKIAKILAH